MAHELYRDDKMAFREEGGWPWHGMGEPIPASVSNQEFIQRSGILWKSTECPAWMPDGNGGFKLVPGFKIILRETDGKPLSVVSTDFNDVQNEEVWEFFREFCDEGHMEMETAGTLQGGRKVWGLAKLGTGFKIGEDEQQMYALFSTGHFAGYATQAELTAVRVVCNNTLSCARMAETKWGRFRLTHLAQWDEEARRQAKGFIEESLGITDLYRQKAERLASFRTTQTLDTAFFIQLFQPDLLDMIVSGRDMSLEQLLFSNTAQQKVGQRTLQALTAGWSTEAQVEEGRQVLDKLFNAIEKKEHLKYQNRKVEELQSIVKSQPGAGLAPGTMWNTFNAVTYYIDHEAGRQPASAIDSALFGAGRNTKATALDLAVAYTEMARG